MNWLRRLRLLWQLPPNPPSPADTQKEQDRRVRNIVSRLSTGNLRLRMGLFTTQAQHDARKAEVLAHNFEPRRMPLENLRITKPRTDEQIRQAFAEKHFAEMTPHQAGEP